MSFLIPRLRSKLFIHQLRLQFRMALTTRESHLDRTAGSTRQEVIATAEIKEIKSISKTVKLLHLLVPNEEFSFKAGQWVDMMIPGVERVAGFSMCSSPQMLFNSRIIHLAIKDSGHTPSLWVHNKCQVGSQVDLRVGGDIFYDPVTSEDKKKNLLLVAGGIGINPMFSMLQHFVNLQSANESSIPNACLLYSAQSTDELIFKDDLLHLSSNAKNVKLHFFVTKEQIPDSEIAGRRIVAADIKMALATLKETQAETDVYVCGPSRFIEDVSSYCTDAGVPKTSVKFEKWDS